MTYRTLLLVALLVLPGGCAREDLASPRAASATALAELDRLDTRRPVPLLPMMADHQKQNMRDHLLVVQEIVAALATDDYAAIERATGRIGFSEPVGQMCTHMGEAAPGFADRALGFHHAADRIASAARDRDRVRVLTELGATLETCTSCHADWKQQVVDEARWRDLTSSPPPGAAD
jgi:hypothetical protein